MFLKHKKFRKYRLAEFAFLCVLIFLNFQLAVACKPRSSEAGSIVKGGPIQAKRVLPEYEKAFAVFLEGINWPEWKGVRTDKETYLRGGGTFDNRLITTYGKNTAALQKFTKSALIHLGKSASTFILTCQPQKIEHYGQIERIEIHMPAVDYGDPYTKNPEPSPNLRLSLKRVLKSEGRVRDFKFVGYQAYDPHENWQIKFGVSYTNGDESLLIFIDLQEKTRADGVQVHPHMLLRWSQGTRPTIVCIDIDYEWARRWDELYQKGSEGG